jgi:hypothetical protein
VQIRKKVFEGKVVKKKFYDKHYKKWRYVENKRIRK